MQFLISASVCSNKKMIVDAGNICEAKAIATTNLFTSLNDNPMYRNEALVIDESVESVRIRKCECLPDQPNDNSSTEHEPIEFFSD